MPYFGQEIFEKSGSRKGPLTDKAYRRRPERRYHDLTRTKGLDAAFSEHRLDALVAITDGPAHPTDLVNGDAFTGGSSSPAAVAGYPASRCPRDGSMVCRSASPFSGGPGASRR